MHPDDDSQTTLSKWPFVLGDVLLVAAALAIAILGGWQLTDWQVGACVAAVALGAGLFVLPYVVEFQVRVREEREDRAADIRILEKHILAVGQTLDGIDARLRALERAKPAGDPQSAALAEIADQKIERLEAARASQEEATRKLQRRLDELSKDPADGVDPEILKSVETRLAALEASPKRPALASDSASPEGSSGAAAPPAEKKAPVKPEKTTAQIERPKRSARERHGPEESRLLRRAISERGNNSSSAVSRIIESKAKEQRAALSPKDTASEDTAPEPGEEKKKEAIEASVGAASEPMEEGGTAENSNSPADVADSSSGPAGDPAAESPEMLFDEAKVSSPAPRAKAKKKDAAVTASVFIGIGNKPYLRGSGGGLNWEKGAPMEFKEIGKWQWVAPSNLDAALEVQVFRNDEDPDTLGRYALKPGQKLELKPVF